MLIAGVVIVIDPEIVFGHLKKHADKLVLQILAVVVRLLLGALLVYLASTSKFPVAIEVIGWISIIAAVSLAVIGRSNFKKLLRWAMTFQKSFGRIGGIFATAVGGFLIYAFV